MHHRQFDRSLIYWLNRVAALAGVGGPFC